MLLPNFRLEFSQFRCHCKADACKRILSDSDLSCSDPRIVAVLGAVRQRGRPREGDEGRVQGRRRLIRDGGGRDDGPLRRGPENGAAAVVRVRRGK